MGNGGVSQFEQEWPWIDSQRCAGGYRYDGMDASAISAVAVCFAHDLLHLLHRAAHRETFQFLIEASG